MMMMIMVVKLDVASLRCLSLGAASLRSAAGGKSRPPTQKATGCDRAAPASPSTSLNLQAASRGLCFSDGLRGSRRPSQK